MTNSIDMYTNLQAGNVVKVTDPIKTNKKTINSDFNDLLSLMMTSQTSFSGSSNVNGSGDLSSLIYTLFAKLFGENGINSSSNLSIDSPEGKPLNGIITQVSHNGHVALDYGVPIGTSVHTTMSGKVTYAGWNNEGYGNLVIVENGPYKTYYAHLSKIPVSAGQIVKEGAIIGLSGNTGNSTGPHLHYEVRKNGVAVDPASTM